MTWATVAALAVIFATLFLVVKIGAFIWREWKIEKLEEQFDETQKQLAEILDASPTDMVGHLRLRAELQRLQGELNKLRDD